MHAAVMEWLDISGQVGAVMSFLPSFLPCALEDHFSSLSISASLCVYKALAGVHLQGRHPPSCVLRQVGAGWCVVPLGTAQDLDLGFSCPILPSMGPEQRPEGGDKYSHCGSDWKHILFPTATRRGAMGLKEFGACVHLSFPSKQPLVSCGLSAASPT